MIKNNTLSKWKYRKIIGNPHEEDNNIAEIKISEKESSQLQASNKLYFYGDITNDSALMWNRQLDEMSKTLKIIQTMYDLETPPPLYIYVQSEGGDFYASFSVAGRIETMKKHGFNIYTVVDGFCASGATIISVTGTKRLIRQYSGMLIHQLSSSFWGTYREFQDEKENVNLMMTQLRMLYGKYTKFSQNELENMLSHDLYLDTESCINVGLADEVV